MVLTEHLTRIVKGKVQPWKIFILKLAYQKAEKIFAVSPALAEGMKPFVGEKTITVIHNLVDETIFYPSEQAKNLTPFIFSSIGRLEEVKGFDLLIKAFHKSFHGADVQLNIAGSGTKYEALSSLIEELKLKNQVKLLGSLSRLEVRELLQSSHVLVSSSSLESFGVTLIEAMACGLPVVSTMSGGPECFIEKDMGILVPSGDVDQLADALLRMKNTYSKYDPLLIRSKCVERFGQ